MTIEPAQLQFDDRGLPRSTRFNDVYYSDASAVAESNAVFVDCARQHPRWQTMSAHTPFTIAELGFGFGLNFLLSARAWLQQQSSLPTPLLHYLAFEKYPPAAAALQRVHALWPDLAELAADLRRDYPRCGHGCHRILLRPGVILDLYLGDAAGQLARRIPRPVDCWYLDGFAPGGNPELWDSQVLALVAGSSHGNTRLCSYSVAGKLRRELSSEGFTVTKLPGFGRKRHRLLAQFDQGAAAKPASLYLPANLTPQSTGTATIVGAGLAGCAVAASLARRGWRITIVDGCADSGIPIAGIGKLSLGLRIFREDSAAARFYLLAYLHALGVYRQLASSGRLRWHESGLIQLSNALNRKHGQADLPRLYDPSLLRAQTQHELSDIAGLALGGDGFYQPASGYLDPTELLAAWLDHPNITLRHSEVIALNRSGDQWELLDRRGHRFSDPVVVVASGANCTELAPFADLPLESVSGQVSSLAMNAETGKLKTIVCGERTLFPADHNTHLVAASYGGNGGAEIDEENRRLAGNIFQQPGILDQAVTGSATAWRCRSSDYLPIVGPVPDWPGMRQLLAPLQRNAKAVIDAPGKYLPGLYLSTAHGSNGMASCPLAGEYLASLICNENLPVDGDTVAALHPLRFLLRKLKRQEPA